MQRKDFLFIIGSTAIVLLLAAGGLGLLFWQHARAGGFALRSEDAPLYLNEARDRMARREYAGALEIYTRAIEADPTLVTPYLERADAHEMLGDYDAALAEFDRAVQADTRELHSFFGRGVTHLLLGHLDNAVSDLREAVVLGTGESDYPRLYLWIARARLAGTDEADAELRAAVDQERFMSAWALMIARFLLDDLSEEEFLNEAQLTFGDLTTAEKNCEALYYAAAKRAVWGDEDGAVTLFKACLATGVRTYCEYHSALAELRQRGFAPASAPETRSDQ